MSNRGTLPPQRIPIESAAIEPHWRLGVSFLQIANLQGTALLVQREPFPFLVATGQLPDAARDALNRDFPRYASAGFFPHEPSDCGESINRLIDEVTAGPLADVIGEHLGIDKLGAYPSLVTLCRSLNRRHGTIHTDSRSKVATALLYLNESWPETSEGCLRFLTRSDSIEDMVTPEIRPLYGTLVVFKRSDNSFHGHLPYEGERRVIQVAWLTSEEEKLRKTQRGKFSRLFKKLFGRLDRKLGAGRKDNAAHLD